MKIETLGWMAGRWRSEGEHGLTEELWMPPAGGLMLGLHRDLFPSGKVFFEYLRIESSAGGPLYQASPAGRPPTPFRAVELSERHVVFENPDHDFPQRIIYRLDSDGALLAAVEGEGRRKEWRWERDRRGF